MQPALLYWQRTGDEHKTSLRLSGFAAGAYDVIVDGVAQGGFSMDDGGVGVTLACGEPVSCDVVIRKALQDR